jgi:hypothetical protein
MRLSQSFKYLSMITVGITALSTSRYPRVESPSSTSAEKSPIGEPPPSSPVSFYPARDGETMGEFHAF